MANEKESLLDTIIFCLKPCCVDLIRGWPCVTALRGYGCYNRFQGCGGFIFVFGGFFGF